MFVIPYSKTVFPNGLRVVYRRLSSPLVALNVWVRSGVRHEEETRNGIAHYFEHMVFKGSDRYPGPLLSRRIQALGGTMNAGTSLDTTDFYLVVPRDFWQEAVPLLRELIWESRFDPVEMENEKHVVLQEMNLEEDEPEEKLSRALYESVFAETPYARSILGTEQTIQNITRQDLFTYRETSLYPANLVLAVAGDLPEEEVLSVVDRFFIPPTALNSAGLRPFPTLPVRRGEQKRIRMDIAMTYGAVGFSCPGIKEDTSYSLRLLAGILGDGIASRLNLRLREKRGLVDSIQASFVSYEKAGLFAVSYVFLEGNAEQVEEAIRQELEQIRDEPPSLGEMKRAINLQKTAFYQVFETALGNTEVLGRLDSVDTVDRIVRYLPILESLGGADLQESCQRYLDWERGSRVLICPNGEGDQ